MDVDFPLTQADPPLTLSPDNQLGLSAESLRTEPTQVVPPEEGHRSGAHEACAVIDVDSELPKGDEQVKTPKPKNDERGVGTTTTIPGDVADEEYLEEPGIEEKPPAFLSVAAAAARLRRACTPNSKGEYKVPPEVAEQWKDTTENGGRRQLESLFEKCGHETDWVYALVSFLI